MEIFCTTRRAPTNSLGITTLMTVMVTSKISAGQSSLWLTPCVAFLNISDLLSVQNHTDSLPSFCCFVFLCAHRLDRPSAQGRIPVTRFCLWDLYMLFFCFRPIPISKKIEKNDIFTQTTRSVYSSFFSSNDFRILLCFYGNKFFAWLSSHLACRKPQIFVSFFVGFQ